MRWVRQEDPEGCGVAVLAMLTGQTFAEVDQAFPDRRARDTPKERCLEPHHMQNYLWDRGYFLRLIRLAEFAPDGRWPPRPFAPLHYVNVTSPSGTGHWVAMEMDGCVLDPLRKGTYQLDFYPAVHEVVGIFPDGHNRRAGA